MSGEDPIIEDPENEGEGTEPEVTEPGDTPEEPEVNEEEQESTNIPDCDVGEVGFNGPRGTPLQVCTNVEQPKNLIDGVAYARVELMEQGPTAEVLVPSEEEEEEE